MDFEKIKSQFGSEWDIGLLDTKHLKIVANTPIKFPTQPYGASYDMDTAEFFDKIPNAIVLVKHSHISLDYSLYLDAEEILKTIKPLPKKVKVDFDTPWFPLYLNFKMAMVLAGLGVRAMNSLVYSYKFAFDCKCCIYAWNEEITNYEIKKPNLGALKYCKGCNDCETQCPPNAIHHGDVVPWVDADRCDSFIGTGSKDFPHIPSILGFWHRNVYPHLSQEEVDKIGRKIWKLPWDKNGYKWDHTYGAIKDGKVVPIPHCRNCQEQPRCKFYNVPQSGKADATQSSSNRQLIRSPSTS